MVARIVVKVVFGCNPSPTKPMGAPSKSNPKEFDISSGCVPGCYTVCFIILSCDCYCNRRWSVADVTDVLVALCGCTLCYSSLYVN